VVLPWLSAGKVLATTQKQAGGSDVAPASNPDGAGGNPRVAWTRLLSSGPEGAPENNFEAQLGLVRLHRIAPGIVPANQSLYKLEKQSVSESFRPTNPTQTNKALTVRSEFPDDSTLFPLLAPQYVVRWWSQERGKRRKRRTRGRGFPYKREFDQGASTDCATTTRPAMRGGSVEGRS
jgi:hypothetical protein